MKKLRFVPSVLAIGFLALAFTSPAHAQASRTWVSGVGDDANPCSRTAPCKTFAGAISKTAPAGEINCLDPAGYGAVTIGKAITIDCGGTFGSVLVSGTNGIVVAAGANDVVNLRHLDINGMGTGLSGILYQSGKALHVESVIIYSFVNAGITANVSAVSMLTLSNVITTNTGAAGLSLNASAGNIQTDIDHFRVANATSGINGLSNSIIYVRNSDIAYCGVGVTQQSASTITVTASQFSGNGTGAQSHSGSAITLFGNTFGSNGAALNPNGGAISSDGQNNVVNNGANGVANGAAPTKI